MRQILFMLIFNTFGLIGQETIAIKFNEAEPIWVHTMVDTTFVPVAGQEYFTKYSSLSPHSIHRDENDIYAMAVCLEKRSLDDYGFVLDKIDIKTGQKSWSHHNTPYNYGQKDIYHNLYFYNNKIEMVGAVQTEDFREYASYKIMDKQSGQLQKYVKSSKILPGIYTRYFTGYVLESDSILLNAYTLGSDDGTIENPAYKYGINAEVYDKNMLNMTNARNLFDFDTLGPFSIDQPNYTLRLNKNTLISLAYKDRYESWDNLGTKMMWTDISDPFHIKTKQIKDYTKIVPGTKENFRLQRFNAINNTIHLSHYYPNFDIRKNTCYILWLDSMGDIKTFIPIPKYGDHIYQFAEMIYANNNFAYLYAFPSVKNIYGFDIIRINHGIDTIQYIASLTSAVEGESFVKNFNIHTLFDDDYLIIGGYTAKEGQGTKTSLKIYCFRASDLGINFEPVSITDTEIIAQDYNVFPNPTHNTLYLKLATPDRNNSVDIYDLHGKCLLSQSLEDIYSSVDVSRLAKGIYLINVTNEKGEKIGKTLKLVKVE